MTCRSICINSLVVPRQLSSVTMYSVFDVIRRAEIRYCRSTEMFILLVLSHCLHDAVEDRNYEALVPLKQSMIFDEHRPCDPLIDAPANSIRTRQSNLNWFGFLPVYSNATNTFNMRQSRYLLGVYISWTKFHIGP